VAGAIAALKETIRLDDKQADAYYLLGVCLREQQRVPDALTALEQALTLAPGLVPAREELADLYGSIDRHAEELDQLQVIAGLDRDRVARQVAIGLAHARAGHRDLAVRPEGGAPERARSTARSARGSKAARRRAFLARAARAVEQDTRRSRFCRVATGDATPSTRCSRRRCASRSIPGVRLLSTLNAGLTPRRRRGGPHEVTSGANASLRRLNEELTAVEWLSRQAGRLHDVRLLSSPTPRSAGPGSGAVDDRTRSRKSQNSRCSSSAGPPIKNFELN
jgi:hypothetical protein